MRAAAASIASTWFLSVTQGCMAGLPDPHYQTPHCSWTGQRPHISVMEAQLWGGRHEL